MIKPEIELEQSIKVLELYGIPKYIIENMLTNLQKILNQKRYDDRRA